MGGEFLDKRAGNLLIKVREISLQIGGEFIDKRTGNLLIKVRTFPVKWEENFLTNGQGIS
jgi:hypothetical protein